MTESASGIDYSNFDPLKMKTMSDQGEDCNTNLKAQLNRMNESQDELYVAVKGQTGNAIYKAFTTAYESGTALHQSLQGIMQELRGQGVEIDAADQDTAAEYARLGISGGPSDLVSSGTAATAAHKLHLDNWGN
ncbi:hypothetical protein [Nocardia sp. NBC_00403]|uniref:hypothetical protein n=1 Tax=Nocardia sp. NBC_00403 TaxID=2975990 RepID=UPI002E1CEBF8